MEWLLHGLADLFGILHDVWMVFCAWLAVKCFSNSQLVAKLLPWSVDAIAGAWFIWHGWHGWRHSVLWNWTERYFPERAMSQNVESEMPTKHMRPDGSWQELVTTTAWKDCPPPEAPQPKPRARVVNPMRKPTTAGF